MNNCSLIMLLLFTHFAYGQEAPHLGRLIENFPIQKTSSEELQINEEVFNKLATTTLKRFSIDLDDKYRGEPYIFEQVKSHTSDFQTRSSSGKVVNLNPEKIYKSYKSNEYLMVMVIRENDLELLTHNNKGQFILTHENESKDYFYSKITNIDKPDAIFCNTLDSKIKVPKKSAITKNTEILPDIKVYLEVDYYTYQDFGGDLKSIQSWANSLFTHTAALYAIHEINIVLSEIFVWDSQDPYSQVNSIVECFDNVNSTMNRQFNGHIAQLLTTKHFTSGGGIANMANLCERNYSDGPFSIASRLSKSSPSDSHYSWDVFVMAHEIGHLLGSQHTHSCVWGINQDSALDSCYPTEGGCNSGPYPTNGGTIMSYCFQWNSIGVNFANGFGSEPSQRIKEFISSNSSCINQSSSICYIGQSCDDQNICTENDKFDNNCNCMGTIIDINQNNICDLLEECNDSLQLNQFNSPSEVHMAKLLIISNATPEIIVNSIALSAGEQIIFECGFEILKGTTLTTQLNGCDNID